MTQPDGPVFVAEDAERLSTWLLANALAEALPERVRIAGVELLLPPTLQRALTLLAEHLALGLDVALTSSQQSFTAAEAAALLGEPCAAIEARLADGSLSAVAEPDGSPRIPLAALLAYDRERRQTRRAALRELTRIAEEAGQYEQEWAAARIGADADG